MPTHVRVLVPGEGEIKQAARLKNVGALEGSSGHADVLHLLGTRLFKSITSGVPALARWEGGQVDMSVGPELGQGSHLLLHLR
jgi:hypothetical protein